MNSIKTESKIEDEMDGIIPSIKNESYGSTIRALKLKRKSVSFEAVGADYTIHSGKRKFKMEEDGDDAGVLDTAFRAAKRWLRTEEDRDDAQELTLAPQAEVKRPRGRPRKSHLSSDDYADTSNVSSQIGAGDGRDDARSSVPVNTAKPRGRPRKTTASKLAHTETTEDPDRVISYMTRTIRRNKTLKQQALNKVIRDVKLLGSSGIERADIKRMARQYRIHREPGIEVPRAVLKVAFTKIKNEIHAAVSANVELTKRTALKREEAVQSDFRDIVILGIEIEIVDDDNQIVAWVRRAKDKVIESSDESSDESTEDDVEAREDEAVKEEDVEAVDGVKFKKEDQEI